MRKTLEVWKQEQKDKVEDAVEKALQERSSMMLTDDQGYCNTIWQSVTFKCSFTNCEKHGIDDMSLGVEMAEPYSRSQLIEIMNHALQKILIPKKRNKCSTNMTFHYWYEEYEDNEDD